MRRRGTVSRKSSKPQRRKPTKPKRNNAVRRAPPATSTDATLQEQVSILTRELADAREQLAAALQQQNASSEVLNVISRSPGELQPVFDTILQEATRVCQANFGLMIRYEGGSPHPIAFSGVPQAFVELAERDGTFSEHAPAARAARTKQTVHVADFTKEYAYAVERHPMAVAGAEIAGIRTLLVVPMLKEGDLIGNISIYRQEVRPFTDKQIALVQNFAAQAVIAIENARLLNELHESLQQQTATADVLKVISRAAFDLQTVLDTLAESATRVCNGDHAGLTMREGDVYRYVATYALADEFFTFLRNRTLAPGRDTIAGRTALEGKVVHVADLAADPEYRMPEAVTVGKIRTTLGVPLLRDGVVIGTFTVNRQRVEPFTERQIELVQTFADQAVIAIENARLLNELRQRTDDLTESLEQQTATAEVLKIISSAAGDLKPVFDAILENATRICEATFGNMLLREGDAYRRVAMHNAPPNFREFSSKAPNLKRRIASSVDRAIDTGQAIHILDVATEGPNEPIAKFGGARTLLSVPMLKDNEAIGVLGIYRQEVRPFTNKQIELVQNFAAQAVIAIENARLLNELKESLEQQTATADVLRVISSSPGELNPVFNAMLENAVRLCEAEFGNLFLYDGEAFHAAAVHSASQAYTEVRRRPIVLRELHPEVPIVRMARTKAFLHIADVKTERSYERDPIFAQFVDVSGARTALYVPMLTEKELTGAFIIYRLEVRPFTDKQIALVQNFAAQAVIAIENTRLLNELRQSLQQQTATADVLKTISRSTFDLQTVLDTLVQSAARLCEADNSFLFQRQGANFIWSAGYGHSPEYLNYWKERRVLSERGSAVGRAAVEGKIIHIPDVLEDKEYTNWDSQRIGGYRSVLGVPLLREHLPIGVIGLTRSKPRAFSEQHIDLLQTFADQAAIAIENVRLFDEIHDKSRQLEVASQHKSQFLANIAHPAQRHLGLHRIDGGRRLW